jgi:hypothetical protein
MNIFLMLSVYKSSTKSTIDSGSCKLWTIYNAHYQYASNYLKFTSFRQRCINYKRSPFHLDETSKDFFPNTGRFLFSGNINCRKNIMLGWHQYYNISSRWRLHLSQMDSPYNHLNMELSAVIVPLSKPTG